jgi:hypothetical protein
MSGWPMTEDRPRPEYGEYATPEQQAAAMGRKYVAPEPEPTAPAAVLPQVVLARPPGYANRFFTVFLLGLGAITLIERIPAYFSYASSFKGEVTAMGYPSVTVPSSLDAAGIPTLVANIALFAATILISTWALRRGRISFYIPIAGAIIYSLVTLILISVYAPGLINQILTAVSPASG